MLQILIDLQREIYTAFADYIRAFSDNGDLLAFATFLPMAIVFGAVHALTPGHSKAVLATYLAGTSASMVRGFAVSLTLSFTHVLTAILIAVFSLPLVSIAFGSVGKAPAIENVSRGLLGVIGLWMIWRAFRGHTDLGPKDNGMLVGVFAGLIPCPLTLFVMIFAIQNDVPEAGVAFAAMMMLGVATTLSVVAVVTVLFQRSVTALIASRPFLLDRTSRAVESAAGLILLLIAFRTIIAA